MMFVLYIGNMGGGLLYKKWGQIIGEHNDNRKNYSLHYDFYCCA